jgi:hypothetical protein
LNPWAEAGPQGRELQKLENSRSERRHEQIVLRKLQSKIGRIPAPDPAMSREARRELVAWHKTNLENFFVTHRKVLARLGVRMENFFVADEAVQYAGDAAPAVVEHAEKPSLVKRVGDWFKKLRRK